MITSNISGRLRFRHSQLKESKILESTLSKLRSIKGVKEVKGNIKTGSILIAYDPNIVVEGKIGIEFSGFTEERSKSLCVKSLCSFLPSVNEHSLLRFSYASTLIGLFIGRRFHIYAGSAFAALSLVHMMRKRDWNHCIVDKKKSSKKGNKP